MGERFLIQGGNKTKMTQIPFGKGFSAEVFSNEEERARKIGEELGVDFNVIPIEEFITGIAVENEHSDITNGDVRLNAKIALAHLKEMPDYYTRLKEVESAEKISKGGPGSGRNPEGGASYVG